VALSCNKNLDLILSSVNPTTGLLLV